MKNGNLSGISAGIILSAFVSFLVFVYAPMEMYLTNISEFWMKLGEIVFPIVICFIIGFALLCAGFAVARLINEKLYYICLALAMGFGISTYIQGNFLVKTLPPMDGTSVAWETFTDERIKSVIVFIVPAVILLFVLIKFREKLLKNIVTVGSICLTLLLSVTLTSLFMTTDTKKQDNLVCTVKNEFQLSDDRNLIVLILDAVDSNRFKTAMENDGELAEALDGFTYYDDALAAYPFTSRSLPMIFSGEWYENDRNFDEYRTNAMKHSPVLNALEKENYNIGIYEKWELGLEESIFAGKIENCSHAYIDIKFLPTYNLILKMYGVKFAPWDFKKYCWAIEDYAAYCRRPDSEYSKFYWVNSDFYKQLEKSDCITKSENKCARIIHLGGGHVPFCYDKNMNIIKNGTYQDNVEACVTAVKKYISRLKENGVYDNSAIVILADHGYNEFEDNGEELYLTLRMHPLLMVKGINEKHEMNTSAAPISYTDLADGITKLIGGEKGDSIFGFSDGDTRTRRALLYRYLHEEFMEEYTLNGRADDTDALTATGKKYEYKK